jgi:hypothetical protein
MSNPASRMRARTLAQLAEHLAAIQRNDKQTIENIIDSGKHLIAAKKLAGHGYWLQWLKQDLRWSETSALRHMRVAELSKSVKLTDLSIDLTASTPLPRPRRRPRSLSMSSR